LATPPGAAIDPAARRASRLRVLGFCAYDFANSSYTTLISTVAYPVYFSQVVVGEGDRRGDLAWSLATASVHVFLILLAPLLGALADESGRKKRMLLLTTLQTVVACALLAAVGPGDLVLGVVLYVVASVGFEAGYVFYNAFLPEVSTPRTAGRVSGLSWGVGFLGGLAALAACSPLLRPLRDGAAGPLVDDALRGYRLAFVVVAGFFALFSIPTFLLLPERASLAARASGSELVRRGMRRVRDTLGGVRRHRESARFAVAALCFTGGVETVIKFAALYAFVSFGIQGAALTVLFVLGNVAAFPGTLLAGVLADRVGPRRALAATLVGWFLLVLAAAGARSATAFWLIGPGIAIGMGATQAIGRAVMAEVSPPERIAEFFGFYALCGKVGSILGLVLFGALSFATGSQRLAVVGVAPLFLLALAVLASLPPDRARAG
jgi:UMF1 family MFS transporter